MPVPRSGRLPPVRAAPAALGGGAGGDSRRSVLPARVMLPWTGPRPGCRPGGDRRDKRAGGVSAVGCLEEGPAGDTVPQKDPQGWGHCCPAAPGGCQLVACRVDSATPAPAGGAPLLGVTSLRFPCRELRRAPRPVSLPSSWGGLGSIEGRVPELGGPLGVASRPLSPMVVLGPRGRRHTVGAYYLLRE